MKALALLAGLALAPAHAQTPPAPAPQDSQRQEAPAKPRPQLKLNLEEVDPPRSHITFKPREDRKDNPTATLPGMGGERTRVWEAPSDKVFPPDTNPNAR